MTRNVNDQVREYGKKHRFYSRWARLLGALACVVVFCTTYALVLPALTLDRATVCGMEEHTHSEDCYETVLTCGMEENSGTEGERVLICELEEDENHTHTADCYETVREEGHTHTEGCYEKQLICGMEEHTHTEDCYEKETQEQSTAEETERETASGDAVDGISSEETETTGAPKLICGLEEGENHTHTAECYAAEAVENVTEEYEEETETETETETEPETKTEKESPAQDFSGRASGVTVAVSAPEGAFPADTKMTVKEAGEEAIQAAADAVGADASDVKAVDITFTCDGEEIEPALPISVKLTAALVAQAEEAVVVHVDDEAQAEIVSDTTVENRSVSFEADAFSVYAIVDGNNTEKPRYTFKFYALDGEKEENIHETQIIKADEYLTQPAMPDTPEEYDSFEGWYIGGTYTIDDEDVIHWGGGTKVEFGPDNVYTATELKNLDTHQYYNGTIEVEAAEDYVIQVWARYTTAYHITFYDSYEKYSAGEIPGVVAEERANANGEFNIGSVTAEPDENGMVFKCWVDENGKEVATTTGGVATFTGDTKLYAMFAKGYSLVFDANDEGDATVTATQYVIEGNRPVAPANPTRPGYTFNTWTTDQEGRYVYDFGELTKDTIVYAQWTPTNTTYTVIIWHQSIDDDKNAEDSKKTYDYETYYTANASTGAPISASMVTAARVTDSDGSTTTVNCTNLTYEGFDYSTKAWDSEDAVIAANGSTVINVYYDRKLITMNFTGLGSGYIYTESNRNDQNMYGLVNGEYVALTRSSSWWGYSYTVTSTGASYTGQRYTRSTGTQMTGLYGQTLAQNGYTWPTTNNSGNAVNWSYTRSDNSTVNQTFMEAFMFPGGETNVTFTSVTANGRTINFYQQNLDGGYSDSPTTTITTSTSNTNFNISDKYTGFHAVQYRTLGTANNATWSDWRAVGDLNTSTGYYGNSLNLNNYSSVEIRYERNKYFITFYNGEYTSDEDYSVLYGTDISGLDPNEWEIDPDEIPCPYKDEAEHYYLAGWYANQEGTVEFNWNRTMPANNLMVYAVWKPYTYKVTFDPGAGTIAGANEDGVLIQEVAYKDRAISPESSPTLENHVFLGWTYVDKEGNEVAWTFNNQITEDVTLTAKWSSESTLILQYYAKNGDGKYELFHTDPNIYDDGADTIITSKVPSGRFIGWESYPGSGTLFTAGDPFVVNTENDIADGTLDTYVKLIAAYDELPDTSITFDANGGVFKNYAETYVMDLSNNAGVDLDSIANPTREHYKFVGWNTAEDGSGTTYTGDGKTTTEEIGVDNIDEDANILYAVWEALITLNVTKVDSADTDSILSGAEFALYYTAEDTDHYWSYDGWTTLDENETAGAYALPTGDNGTLTFTDLEKGQTYYLLETKAPDGYNLLEEIVIVTVKDDGVITASYGSNGGNNMVSASGNTITVKNSSGVALPNTGGTGTLPNTIGGLLLMAGAVMYGYMLRRKRERRANN